MEPFEHPHEFDDRPPAQQCHTHGHPKPELENVDPSTALVFHALGRIMHLNRLVISKTFAQRGLQHWEAFALPLLGKNEGLSQRELGETLHLSPPRVSMILRSLEEDGTIARRPDETDRRLTRVYLTPEGRRREAQQRTIMETFVNRTIGTLTEAERQELARLLGRLADNAVELLHEESQTRPRTGEGAS